MRVAQSTDEILAAELSAVAGERCGHTCEHHAPLVCGRAAGHEQAESGIAVDMHVGLAAGRPVLFDGGCDRHGQDGPVP